MSRARKADQFLLQAEREALASTPDGLARPRVDRNKTPLVGWHPPAPEYEWLNAEIEARGGGRGVKSDILTEALQMLRAHSGRNGPCSVLAGQDDDLGACPTHPDKVGDH